MLPDWFDKPLRAPAACRVFVDGHEIDDLYPLLVEAQAILDRQESAEATLLLEDRRLEDGRWAVHDDPRLHPWAEIRLEVSFGSHQERVFSGFIRQLKVELPQDQGGASVILECQDHALLLDRVQRRKRWGDRTPTSDAAIVRSICDDADLDTLEPLGQGFTDLVVNQNESDGRFLRKRAEENGYDLFFRDGALYFGPPRLDRDAQAPIKVYAGADTHALRFAIDDDGHHPARVAYEVAGDDDDRTRAQSVESDLPILGQTPATPGGPGDFTWHLDREGLSDENQARHRARALANQAALRIEASGELDGACYGHVLLPGEPVGVDGIGEQYGGRWLVARVEHRFDADGYRQAFSLLRNGYGDDLEVRPHPLAALF